MDKTDNFVIFTKISWMYPWRSTARALCAGQLRYYLQYSLYPPHPSREQLEWYCEVHVEAKNTLS